MSKTKLRRPISIPTAVGLTCLLLVSFLCFFAARWFVTVYGRIGFDSILFTLKSSLSGVQSDLVQSFLLRAALPTAICALLGFFLLMLNRRGIAALWAVALSVGLLIYAAVDVELTDYVRDLLLQTQLYEDHYADPDTVAITFPEEKRNLVYIMLESMETTYLPEDLGGASHTNLIPELTALAQENINFSHNSGIGGFHATNGASWTIGAIVAQTAGIPLKVPSGIDDWQNGYGKDGTL